MLVLTRSTNPVGVGPSRLTDELALAVVEAGLTEVAIDEGRTDEAEAVTVAETEAWIEVGTAKVEVAEAGLELMVLMAFVDAAAVPVTNMLPVGNKAMEEVEVAPSPSHSSAVVSWKMPILKSSPHISLASPIQGMAHSESSTNFTVESSLLPQ